jgi:hypothetical protein
VAKESFTTGLLYRVRGEAVRPHDSMKNEKPREGRTFDSLKAAAAALRLPMRTLQLAKQAGCPAFRSNRVYESELLAWLETNAELIAAAGDDPRNEKLREEIRKLRLANDQREGRLVERAWVGERIQRAAGELNAARAKSEAEHPVKFAAAAGDVAHCRTIVRGIWDDIFRELQGLAKHFEEKG